MELLYVKLMFFYWKYAQTCIVIELFMYEAEPLAK